MTVIRIAAVMMPVRESALSTMEADRVRDPMRGGERAARSHLSATIR
jgi:hypothetical protein